MSEKITIGNVCFIHREQKLLLLKRANCPSKGKVTGVGGKTLFSEDLKASCAREVNEETGLEITDLKLKAIIKTICEGMDSSWILFVYFAKSKSDTLKPCDEGDLFWVKETNIYTEDLIGFIRLILTKLENTSSVLEGTITHNSSGDVIDSYFN